MDIKTLFEKSLFFDKNVIALSKIYEEGVQKSNKKSWTGGRWSYFLTYSDNLIDETNNWNTFIKKLKFPENSFLSYLIYFVEQNLKGASRTKKLDPTTVTRFVFSFSQNRRDAEYSKKSIKELKAEIPKHIKNLNAIKKNMDWYIGKHNDDKNSESQCEFFKSMVNLIFNTVAFLEELNKRI